MKTRKQSWKLSFDDSGKIVSCEPPNPELTKALSDLGRKGFVPIPVAEGICRPPPPIPVSPCKVDLGVELLGK